MSLETSFYLKVVFNEPKTSSTCLMPSLIPILCAFLPQPWYTFIATISFCRQLQENSFRGSIASSVGKLTQLTILCACCCFFRVQFTLAVSTCCALGVCSQDIEQQLLQRHHSRILWEPCIAAIPSNADQPYPRVAPCFSRKSNSATGAVRP